MPVGVTNHLYWVQFVLQTDHGIDTHGAVGGDTAGEKRLVRDYFPCAPTPIANHARAK